MAMKNNLAIGVSGLLLPYGRHTPWSNMAVRSYYAAMSQKTNTGNHWSSTENNSNNSWNVNFGDGNVNNNNNKNNGNTVRPAVAHGSEWQKLRWTLEVAYHDCRQGKSSSRQCQDYIPTASEDLDALTTEVLERTYTPDTSTCFLVKYPKLREVFAAAFRDRIIHHWICLRMEPLFEKLCEFQNNVTHNCREGMGTKTAVLQVYNGIKEVTDHYQEPAWIFRGDLVGFFMSIDKQRMCDGLLKFAEKQYHGPDKDILLWLIEVTVMHHPERNCMFNSNPKDWAKLQANKSLFRCEEGKGMPIGNLTTQMFANFFMAEFDGWIQVRLRRHAKTHPGFKWSYNRFVDDFIIVCNDKKFLSALVEECNEKLATMKLKLHKDKRYFQPANHGVMFVGTYIHNNRLYLSNRTLGRFHERVDGYIKYLQKPEREITIAELEHIRATINSYLGFCKGRKTYKFQRALIREFCNKCSKYFFRDRKCTKIKLHRAYRPIYK